MGVPTIQGRAGSRLAAGVGSAARGKLAGYREPITIDRAEGAILVDDAGAELIDYVLALGPMIHGHRPARIRAAVDAALDRYGSMIGLGHDLERQAAELVADSVPGVELVRFSNSGTEAVMMALRIARASTGRQLIVRFEGHFHGWSDIAHWSVKPALDDAGPTQAPVPVAAVRGIPESLAHSMIVLPWNDEVALETVLRDRGHEIAAVIMEPLMANYGCLQAKPGYLARVRALTRDAGVLLIFDEVVTGFRLALGGAQQFYGVTPDLTTMAKALGGGYPVSAVGGTAAAMQEVDDERLPYLGTYNTSPLCMAAVVATIEWLREAGIYEQLHATGERLALGLADEFRASGVPATIRGHGPVFQVWFTNEPALNYREAKGQGRPDFYRRFHEAMLARGVLLHPSQFEHLFVSTAHNGEHLDRTLQAAKGAIAEIAPEFT